MGTKAGHGFSTDMSVLDVEAIEWQVRIESVALKLQSGRSGTGIDK